MSKISPIVYLINRAKVQVQFRNKPRTRFRKALSTKVPSRNNFAVQGTKQR